MTQLNGIIKRWWVALIFGVAAIGLGIFMFLNPVSTYVVLSYLFAGYFIAYGLYKSIMTFMERKEIPAWGWSFTLGVLTLILGLMLLIPGMATGTFVYYVAFSVMFMGINSCAVSFQLKEVGDGHWGWTLILGILTILLAIGMLVMPGISVGFISAWFGVMFVMLGINLCMLAYRLSVINSQLKKAETH